MNNKPPQTTNLPKQTQVSLNYWNASTKVDGAEFTTTFQEPLTLNLGDTISVRNSSLDTSQLSNDLIVIEEDLELEFEMIYYAMIRKTEMNFETFCATPRNHQAWLYAKQSRNYYGTPAISPSNDYDPNGTGFVFVNPLWSYMYQAYLGAYINPTDSSKLDEMPELNLNFTNNNYFNTLLTPRPNSQTSATGFNTGSTLSNATPSNTPVLLMNSQTGEPFTRKVKFILKKGFYTRSGLAVQITTSMTTLQNSINKNTSSILALPTINTSPLAEFLIDPLNPSDTFQQNLKTAVQNCEQNTTYNKYTNLNNINPNLEGLNPFQVDILAQHTATTPQLVKTATGTSIANYLPTTPTDQFQRLIWKQDGGFISKTKGQAQTLPMGESVCGFANNINFSGTTIGEGLLGYCPPVHFEPFTQNWGHSGNNTCPAGVNPQNMTANGVDSRTSLWGEVINFMRGTLNTDYPTNFGITTTPPKPNPTEYANTYQVQSDNVPQGIYYKHRFLPITINPVVSNPYTCGTYGSPQLALLYDQDKNLFKFSNLHTPIMTATDNKSGAETPSVVRSVGKFCGAYDTTSPFQANIGNTGDPVGNLLTQNQNLEAMNDRHSGIIFTSIKARSVATGLETSFWSDLGFNVEDITIKLDELPKSPNNPKGDTFISQERFNALTTGELVGISQNINALNTTGSINEQVQAPLRYTYGYNYNSALDMFNKDSATTQIARFPANIEGDIIFESTNQTNLNANNQPTSVLNALGGNILLEITGYGGGSELQDKDAFAVKSIVSLYYLNATNTYLSSEGDGYTYTHLSNTPQTISALKVRILNPITKQKLSTLLGNNNSVYLTITQNKIIEITETPQVS